VVVASSPPPTGILSQDVIFKAQEAASGTAGNGKPGQTYAL